MTPPRADRPERLDAPELEQGELARALWHVAAVNRWLGAFGAVRRRLRSVVGSRATGTLVDVGTGNALHLRRMVGWARSVGGEGWRGVGVDLHPDILAVAREEVGAGAETLRLVRGDARRLPLATDSADVVICTLTLHHFDDGTATRVVREMGRVARSLVVVNDLHRSRAGYWAARLLAATWWRGNRFTRHDGPLSVLRSFTPAELEAVGRRAGLRHPTVRSHLPFRLLLTGEPPTNGAGGSAEGPETRPRSAARIPAGAPEAAS